MEGKCSFGPPRQQGERFLGRERSERIWAEIALERVKENIRLIKKISQAKILLAVKADAYGHGAKEIASYLKGEVAYFGVASVEEGISLRQNGTNKTNILVLSPIPYSRIPLLFKYNLMPTVTEREFLKILAKKAAALNKKISLHLEVDTGMGRTGFLLEEALELIPEILANPYLLLAGIFSHFPAADSDFVFTRDQIFRFREWTKKVRGSQSPIIFHLANSAGVINFPNSHFQMIRPGLLAYGILPDAKTHNSPFNKRVLREIKPVLSLYSRIVNLRRLKKGHSVSYGRRFITQRDSLIAVISAGYGDGIPYSLTNRGEVLIRGQRAPIVGQVCMDLMMADVSHIPDVSLGDRVTIIGRDGPEEIKVTDLAFWANTIPYEITCRISPRVRRVFKEEEKIIRVR